MPKVLIFSNQGLSNYHLGMELEIIEDLQKRGDEITILRCNNTLNCCYFNPTHNLIGCAICETRARQMHKSIGFNEENVYYLKKYNKENYKTSNIDTLNELLALDYKGVNIGRGIASSVISIFRDYNIDNSESKKKLITEKAQMAINVIKNIDHYYKVVQPDTIYIFNGRFCEVAALVNWCIYNKVNFYTFEAGSSKKKYQLFYNGLPHSIKIRQQLLKELVASHDSKTVNQYAKNWYNAKRMGKNEDDKNYLTKQKTDSLPEGFHEYENKIVIFNSSEDEMKAIGEWENDIYSNQNEAIKNIVEYFLGNKAFHFFLRMHPNLDKVINAQTEEIYSWNYDNLTIIKPDENVDSYALAVAADKVITFASTIGVEATYWGTPSILLGKAFYDNQDCVYIPKDYDHLFQLISKENLAPKPKENTYQYGFFASTFGIPFKRFIYNDKNDCTYKGVPMKRIYGQTIIRFLSYVKRIPLWSRLNKLILNKPLSPKYWFLLKSHTNK